MKLGVVGLGRMGENIVRRLARSGHACVVMDTLPSKATALASDVENVEAASDVADLVRQLEPPRSIWVMVPAGEPTESAIRETAALLEADDVIIDGGNTNYLDDVRRAKELSSRGIHYLDVGTSGGIWGLERGYCLMIGGDAGVVRRLQPIFEGLAPGFETAGVDRTPGRSVEEAPASEEHGYLHCGPVGSGHFVKMVHNAIEYGMMQAYAEGFDLLRAAGGGDPPYELDLARVAELWRRGSVIPSWLLDLTAEQLWANADLARDNEVVGDSGEGRWALQTAVDLRTPMPALTGALFARFGSQGKPRFANRVLSAMRRGFGGHG